METTSLQKVRRQFNVIPRTSKFGVRLQVVFRTRWVLWQFTVMPRTHRSRARVAKNTDEIRSTISPQRPSSENQKKRATNKRCQNSRRASSEICGRSGKILLTRTKVSSIFCMSLVNEPVMRRKYRIRSESQLADADIGYDDCKTRYGSSDGGAHPPDPAPALKGRRKNICLTRHKPRQIR